VRENIVRGNHYSCATLWRTPGAAQRGSWISGSARLHRRKIDRAVALGFENSQGSPSAACRADWKMLCAWNPTKHQRASVNPPVTSSLAGETRLTELRRCVVSGFSAATLRTRSRLSFVCYACTRAREFRAGRTSSGRNWATEKTRTWLDDPQCSFLSGDNERRRRWHGHHESDGNRIYLSGHSGFWRPGKRAALARSASSRLLCLRLPVRSEISQPRSGWNHHGRSSQRISGLTSIAPGIIPIEIKMGANTYRMADPGRVLTPLSLDGCVSPSIPPQEPSEPPVSSVRVQIISIAAR